MTATSDITQKMKKVGDKYADKLLKEGLKPRVATAYMSICARAYGMVLKNEAGNNNMLDFAAKLQGELIRSEVYARYLMFCLENGIEAEGRNTFYNILRQLRFKEKKNNKGDRFLIPPKMLPRIER